jgi:hypothetical protein
MSRPLFTSRLFSEAKPSPARQRRRSRDHPRVGFWRSGGDSPHSVNFCTNRPIFGARKVSTRIVFVRIPGSLPNCVAGHGGFEPAHVDRGGRCAQDESSLQIRIGIATGLVVVGDLIGTGSSPSAEKIRCMPTTGGRCARSGEEAVADRPYHAQPYSHRRTCHASTATASHEAAARTGAQAGDCTIISQITRPKAASPKLPSAAPAASSAAASLPRRAPGRPASCLRSRTCFRSMSRLQERSWERQETGRQRRVRSGPR